MTPKSLFNIILKILGVFFIKDILTGIAQLIQTVLYLWSADDAGEVIWSSVAGILILFIYVIVCYVLIFRTDVIIDKLKLEKGFNQETIPLNMHRSNILSIAIIVIGGLLIADEIPNLCQHIYLYYMEKRLTAGQTHPSTTYSIVSAVKIIIGILLIVYQRQIVNLIELRRKTSKSGEQINQ